jgi:3-hydroxyacyl-[acyl-carrier-protein] dehydratase
MDASVTLPLFLGKRGWGPRGHDNRSRMPHHESLHVSKERRMLDIEQIRALLPHRYPMLLVDRILELDRGKRCVGLKNVTVNEDFFNGHFPGQAMMPGVLIIEAMAQVGGVLLLSEPALKGKLAVIAGIENVKFRKPVVPGDALITEVEVMSLRRNFGKIKLTARVNNDVVASCDMMFGLMDRVNAELKTPLTTPAAGQDEE